MRCFSIRWLTRWESPRRSAASTVATWFALLYSFFCSPEKNFLDGFSSQPPSQVEVICETREDWWNALLAWLRSLGGSQGICDILQRLLDFTNSLIHLVLCHLDSKPDPECSETFVANKLAWLKEQDVANTDQLNFTKALLVTVVILVHLAFSILILVFVIPFICNCVGCLNTKVEEVVARTRGTGSSRRTTSTRRTRSARRTTSTRRTRSARRRTTSRRSSRKATPARRTHSTKDKLSIFAAAQVPLASTFFFSTILTKMSLAGCRLWKP